MSGLACLFASGFVSRCARGRRTGSTSSTAISARGRLCVEPRGGTIAMARARFDGAVCTAALIAAICTVASKPGFLKYGETLDCPVNQSKILAVKAIWFEAYKLWKPLTFSQKYIEELSSKVEEHQRESCGARKCRRRC